jgi:glucan endo-1,3-alpha-glucosidase
MRAYVSFSHVHVHASHAPRALLALLVGLAAALSAPRLGTTQPVQAASDPPKVFAHYMVALHGYDETLDGFKQDIRDAQAAGIDGFVLNANPWSYINEPHYKRRMDYLYQAARELNTGFVLFPSLDLCCNATADHVKAMVRAYANQPSHYRYQGRPMVSTFWGLQRGKSFWKDQILTPLRNEGINVFFVPDFPHGTLPEYPTAAQIRSAYDSGGWADTIDGFFWFGAAGTPQQLIPSLEAFAQVSRDVGKPFMSSYTPEYWGITQVTMGRRYYETQGGEGLDSAWRSIITTQRPQWVEVVTWNDFGEASYATPVDAAMMNRQAGVQNQGVPMRAHGAYADMLRDYAQWYKSGTQPAITHDTVYAFYRTHPKDLTASGDAAVTYRRGDVEDVIYLTTRLTAPATLRVTSGGMVAERAMAAGTAHVRVPFRPGTQTFELVRNGQSYAAETGEPIAASITKYNFIKSTAVVRAASDARSAAPAPIPTATPAPGKLEIVSNLSLDKSTVAPGQTISGRVTYKNTGGTPVTIRNIVIAGRPPGGTNSGGPYLDFAPRLQDVTVQPGQTVTVTATRTPTAADPTGTYYAYATYEDAGGAWHDAPSAQNVTFTVTAAPTLPSPTPTPTVRPTATPTPSPTSAPTGSWIAGMTVSGTAWLGWSYAPQGATVQALVGKTVCGQGTVSTLGRFKLTVASTSQQPGCGTSGATVSFTVNSRAASPTTSFIPGASRSHYIIAR